MEIELQTAEIEIKNMQLGSFSRRLVAYLIDILVFSIPGLIANLFIPFLGPLLLWFLYAPVLECSSLCATIGKKVMRLQVRGIRGQQINFKAALLRAIIKQASCMFFPIFLLIFFTRERQTLHDLAADTLVLTGETDLPIVDTWTKQLSEVWTDLKTGIDSPAQPTSGASNSSLPLGELERLQALREKGALTEEEFQKAKADLLAKKS
jgi:uncharacterized RDD family membrane protein YckC